MSLIERMDWDSEHFGLEVWRIVPQFIDALGTPAPDAVEEAKSAGVGLLLWRNVAASPTACSLIDAGFRMADDMVTMRMPLGGTEGWNLTMPVSAAMVKPLLEPFALSRFETIQSLKARGGADGCYEHYLRGYTHAIVVEDTTVGATAWNPQDKVGMLDLLLVAERFRGQGYGSQLLAGALHSMAAAGCTVAETTTWLAEPAALAVYRKAGFKATQRLQTWYLEL